MLSPAEYRADNLHYEKFQDGTVKCIEDEIPFDVPQGWAWCRLQSFVKFIGGDQPPKSTFEYTPSDSNVRLIQIRDYKSEKFITYIPKGSSRRFCTKTDVMIGRYGPPLFQILRGLEGAYNVALMKAVANSNIVINEYLFFLLQDGELLRLLESLSDRTCGQDGINMYGLNHYIVCLPPISEQKRIVDWLPKLLEKANEIEVAKESLLASIHAAKAKVLDLAIRGKLVPQDPTDEPASVLLERIRAEKEELIKQGKIKRDKKDSIIFRGDDNSYYEKVDGEVQCIDEEIPFEIPDTWTWMRLENCCMKEIRRGKSPKYIDESGILVFAQKCNTKYQGIDIRLALCLDESSSSRYLNDEFLLDSDIVINSTGTGTLGRVGFYRAVDNSSNLPIVPDSHVTVIRAYSSIHAFYLYTFMKANQDELEKKGEGSTNQKELKPLTLKEMLVPIPSYSEQKRISEAVDTAFSIMLEIEKSVNRSSFPRFQSPQTLT